MKKIAICLLLIILTAFHVAAQKSKLVKVTLEELQKKESLIDKEAAGEILYQHNEIFPSVNNKVTFRTYLKVKVYDKERLRERYFNGSLTINRFNSLEKLEFNTYNLENGSIAIKKKNISNALKENVNYYFDNYKYSFENVQNGSVLELIYEYTSGISYVFGPWLTEEYIPIVHQDIVLKNFPQNTLVPNFRGSIVPTKEEVYPQFITYHFKNTKAYKELPYVISNQTLMSKLYFNINVHANRYNNWNAIAAHLTDGDWFGKEIRNTTYFQDIVKDILQKKPADMSDTTAIFKHVQTHMVSLGHGEIFFSERNRELYKKQKATDAEINMILISMFKVAGIEAYPVVLSTVNNIVLNPYIPNIKHLNNVIVAVKKNNKEYDFFDASNKYTSKNILSNKNLSGVGFVVDNEIAREVDLSNNTLSHQNKTISAVIDENGLISGRYTHRSDKYFLLSNIEEIDLDAAAYEKDYMKSLISEYYNFKSEVKDGIMRVGFEFKNLANIDIVGNKMLINPRLFIAHSFTRLLEEERNYPLEFFTPQSNDIFINLKMPKDYKIVGMPESKAYDFENGISNYQYTVKEENGLIKIAIQSSLNKARIPASDYNIFKQYINAIWDSTKDMIILEKI